MTVMAKVIETNDSEESVASSEESVASETDDTPGTTNAGWADSIAKILKTNKPKGKKTLVLSKAKKLTDVKRKKTKPAGFEVATAEGDVKQEELEVEDDETSEQAIKRKKKELPSLRVKPKILDKDRERTLSKIATKGVVQLFNAVRMQQKDITKKLDEAGPLEVRKEKVLKSIDKRAFLDVLMGEKSEVVNENVQKSEESTWSVLREDFMMGAKMKDWDKELEEEKETEQAEAEVESE
ncbi:RRP15-like protein [Tribolium castaneum]|uniref:RRP15-like protein n=1 Tax=Tribolium castaneum TaxID=7070 RepID=D6WP55_TRICA|nr:PREDICTED: RRP15-like protein [Tribolium castaneum]EFA07263.2 RRP15-like protein [Tribolium castaneum]|eukprot:XP_971688.3 PREDICTED: RRP15-like protein [Tribolium castaneum]